MNVGTVKIYAGTAEQAPGFLLRNAIFLRSKECGNDHSFYPKPSGNSELLFDNYPFYLFSTHQNIVCRDRN